MTRTCARCAAPLVDGATYYRFALALEAECDVIDDAPGEPAAPDQLLQVIEAMEPEELEAQVHETLSGVVCAPCRQELRSSLRGAAPGEGPLVQ